MGGGSYRLQGFRVDRQDWNRGQPHHSGGDTAEEGILDALERAYCSILGECGVRSQGERIFLIVSTVDPSP